MSDDLISRKAVVDEISYKFGLGDSLISNAIQIIKRLPTAYDVEKVIQQLEENKEDAIKTIEENSPSEFHMIKIRDLKELFEEYTREQIEIVKSGGIAIRQKGEKNETD